MTVMWEVRAADGRADDLLTWVRAHAPSDAALYRSADDRLVVIDETDAGLPEVPADLVARPPHAWRFTPVPR